MRSAFRRRKTRGAGAFTLIELLVVIAIIAIIAAIKPGQDLPLTAASPNNRDVLWLQERSTGLTR